MKITISAEIYEYEAGLVENQEYQLDVEGLESVLRIYSIYNIEPPPDTKYVLEEKEALTRVSLLLTGGKEYVEVIRSVQISEIDIELYKKEQTLILQSMYDKSVIEIENAVEDYKKGLSKLLEPVVLEERVVRENTENITEEIVIEMLKELDDQLDLSVEYKDLEFPNVHPANNVKQILKDFEGESTKYRAHEGTLLLSLFSGEIIEVTENSVTLDCGSGISIEYIGFSEISVYHGQEVIAYQKLGYSTCNYELSLSLNGMKVDLEKLKLKSFISKDDVKG